jgi:secreted trypsin-like serine protease
MCKFTEFILILQLVALLHGQTQEPRVMHGNPVQIKEMPWAVAIVEVGTYKLIGSGTILSDTWVLTAAHLWSPECVLKQENLQLILNLPFSFAASLAISMTKATLSCRTVCRSSTIKKR